MKLAWFTASPDTNALIDELRSAHQIETFDSTTAHNFVWQHFRAPYDLCVFELDNTRDHAFAWPYLLHYSGVVLLRSTTLHDVRASTLEPVRLRDYAAEFAFNHGHPPSRHPSPHRASRGSWPMLRVPLLASRITVVPHRGVIADLEDAYPDARIRYAPIPVPAAPRLTGIPRVEDTVIAARWPYSGERQVEALSAMAAGKPVVVLETAATADWPTLDPQTWLVRGRRTERPIAISIDPRDQEHSLMLAHRRLSADGELRRQLADAAFDWWAGNASPAAAAQVWMPLLLESASLPPPTHPLGWPGHLTADGSERAREILSEFGASVDFLR